MAFKFSETDQEILVSIAEHRVLTMQHLTMLHGRNASALRRRLKMLQAQSLIEIVSRPFGRNRGRPESLVSLHDSGVELLKARSAIPKDLPADCVTVRQTASLDHELLINDFRVQLCQLRGILPVLAVRFYSATSPLTPRDEEGRPIVRERVDGSDGTCDLIEFVPDGAFAFTHQERAKTLLFFLEADRGTEPLGSSRVRNLGVRGKIANYQKYFASEGYKRYEQVLNCKLRGFRLLVLTEESTGVAKLSALVREMSPSDFVWLTDRDKLLFCGVWAPIWVRGGRVHEPPESILGTAMPRPCPTPGALL